MNLVAAVMCDRQEDMHNTSDLRNSANANDENSSTKSTDIASEDIEQEISISQNHATTSHYFSNPKSKNAQDYINHWSKPNLFMRVTIKLGFPMLGAYAAYFSVFHFYESLVYAFIGYWVESIVFLFGHMMLHMQFLDMRDQKVSEVGMFVEGGFLHHYVDPLLYYKMDFTSYMWSYISNTTPSHDYENKPVGRVGKSMLETPATRAEIVLMCLSMVFPLCYGYTITFSVIAFYWAYWFRFIRLCQLLFMFIVDHIFFLGKHNVYIFVHFPIFIGLNALVHLWYHTPQRKRKEYFYYLYWFFNTLESMKIIDTDHHKKHHEHRLGDAEEITVWTDLPQFCVEDLLEQMCIKIFRNGGVGLNELLGYFFLIVTAPVLLLHWVC